MGKGERGRRECSKTMTAIKMAFCRTVFTLGLGFEKT